MDVKLQPHRSLFAWQGEVLLNVYRIIAVAVILLAWQLLSGHLVPTFTVSRPTDISVSLYHYLTARQGWIDIRVTFTEYVWGFAIGTLSGLLVALLFASVRIVGRIFEPILAAWNAVPIIALAPLFIIIFGIGVQSKIAISSIAIFFIMFWNVYVAIKNLPTVHIDMLRVIGAGRWARIRYGVIPAIAPAIFSALRLAVSVAMLGSIIGEFVSSIAGLGHYIEDEGQSFNTAAVMAGIIVAVIIVLVCRGVVVTIEHRVTRWQRAGARKSTT